MSTMIFIKDGIRKILLSLESMVLDREKMVEELKEIKAALRDLKKKVK